nr:MAG TPA: XdhC [Bacteriophage sp.]
MISITPFAPIGWNEKIGAISKNEIALQLECNLI